MDDRELLELAAKAAGVNVVFFKNRNTTDGFFCFTREGGKQKPWNPLQHDGDALRLAVKLCMFDCGLFDVFKRIRLEETRLDPSRNDEVLTRRAIVRASAEIGREL